MGLVLSERVRLAISAQRLLCHPGRRRMTLHKSTFPDPKVSICLSTPSEFPPPPPGCPPNLRLLDAPPSCFPLRLVKTKHFFFLPQKVFGSLHCSNGRTEIRQGQGLPEELGVGLGPWGPWSSDAPLTKELPSRLWLFVGTYCALR